MYTHAYSLFVSLSLSRSLARSLPLYSYHFLSLALLWFVSRSSTLLHHHRDVSGLEYFFNLEHLVLDDNQFEASPVFPKQCGTVHTLWLNANKLNDLVSLLDSVSKAFPRLNYISLLKNPCCPNFFTGKDEGDYQKYRYYTLYRLPQLRFLDASPVNPPELAEAKRIGKFQIPARPRTGSQAVSSTVTADPSQHQAPGVYVPGQEGQDEIGPEGVRMPSAEPGSHGAFFGVRTYVS
eukprot:TRINITY_DN4551_c1_g1_i3.p1 TRINITY_DN4551_c1_g1~~TRINITY_DN4551_c1_g1_i3.p1  ORF type:complete len:236 (-),score=33.30 TRINITY_DN4551_c1_g1_i3:318-1025(-)